MPEDQPAGGSALPSAAPIALPPDQWASQKEISQRITEMVGAPLMESIASGEIQGVVMLVVVDNQYQETRCFMPQPSPNADATEITSVNSRRETAFYLASKQAGNFIGDVRRLLSRILTNLSPNTDTRNE